MFFLHNFEVWLLLTVLSALIYRYMRDHYSFWANRGVPYAKPYSFLGDLGALIRAKECAAELSEKTYQEFKGERFCGVWRFFAPSLFLIDPELIRQILVKDFGTWSDRGMPCNRAVDPLSAHLVDLKGKEWKWMRVKLSTAFTPSRLKLMYTRLLDRGNDFEKYLDNLAATGGVVEAGDMCSRFIIDVVGSCAFGMELNSLRDGDDLFYREIRRELMEPTFRNKPVFAIQTCFPGLFKLLQISVVTKRFTEFFLKLTKQNCDYRDENDLQRNDFLDVLRKLINTDQPLGEDDIEFDEKLLAAQAFEFFSGGFESTPATISYCLHELAVHENVQDRLRKEIHRTKAAHDGEIDLDALNEMDYLDMVVQETLRKYPTIPMLIRKSVEPYRIPGTDVDLPPGSTCDIPVYGIHHDPEYYPDPKKFDPERFTPEAKSQRPAFTFLPFGAGPRGCIDDAFGCLRFADYQVKVGLVKLVDKFKISLCEKSTHPIRFDPEVRFLAPKGGNWIRVSKN